jgi:aminopeptidase N
MSDPYDTRAREARDTAAKARQEQADRMAVEDLKWQMAHKPGRRLAWRLLADTGVFRNPFNQSGSVMAFKAGEMNVGQRLLAEIMQHAPAAFTLMMQEAQEEKQAEKRRAVDAEA